MARAKLSLSVAFGLTVRQVRSGQGVSQEELGLRTGLHRNHVGQIERGEVVPTLKSIEVIAGALGTSAAGLIAAAEEIVQRSKGSSAKGRSGS